MKRSCNCVPHLAGCARFDALVGIPIFREWYGKSADVHGAIPSLHIAYPLMMAYYSLRFGALRAWSIFFYVLMCFSAVYLNHHYILDVIWGSVYAIGTAFTLVVGRHETHSTPWGAPQSFAYALLRKSA